MKLQGDTRADSIQLSQMLFVPRGVSANVRADMSELVKISDLCQWGPKYTKARTRMQASEGGQESSSASIDTLAREEYFSFRELIDLRVHCPEHHYHVLLSCAVAPGK